MLPLVVQVENTREHKADTLAFKKSPVRIGRNALNDLQLDEPFVSQWHAVIRFSEGRTSYLDLGSTNRTLIDGRPTDRNIEVVIEPETDIRIGPLRLHVLRAPAPPEVFGRRRNSAFGEAASLDPAAPPSTVLLADSNGEPGTSLLSFIAEKTLSRTLDAERARPADASSDPGARARPSSPPPAHAPGHASAKPGPARDAEDAPASEYRAYRKARDAFLSSVQRRLEAAPPEARNKLALELHARFPELALESAAATRPTSAGPHPSSTTSGPNMADWLSRLTGGLVPARGTEIDITLAMERVGAVLEVFSQAFVELRRGQEQFCREMSLEHYVEANAFLHLTEDPRALLAYLLASPRESETRLTELSRALADFTLHQVALIGATVEGARRLVEILAPGTLAVGQDPPPDSPAFGQYPALAKLWPRAARKLWRRYLAHHYALVESDRFVRELFGREFARRYYAVTGGSASG
jgi:hypothetical protein